MFRGGNLTLPQKSHRSDYDHHLENLVDLDAIYQDSASKLSLLTWKCWVQVKMYLCKAYVRMFKIRRCSLHMHISDL